MLVAIGTITSTQETATEDTTKAVVKLLNYSASHPDATIWYHASGMVLPIYSDGSYLTYSKARSIASGHLLLSKAPFNPKNCLLPNLLSMVRSILRATLSPKSCPPLLKQKSAHFSITAKRPYPSVSPSKNFSIRNHPCQWKPPILQCPVLQKTQLKNHSKAIDMRFYCIRDHVCQGHLLVYWRPGSENIGDYHTKHHYLAHHWQMRPVYLFITNTPPVQRTVKVRQIPQYRTYRAITTHWIQNLWTFQMKYDVLAIRQNDVWRTSHTIQLNLQLAS